VKLVTVLKRGGLGVLAVLASGAAFDAVGRARDARLAPPPNEMHEVDGRRVRVVCMGEGPRTYLLDSGLGGWSLYWWRIQPSLAQGARACAFDRPGLGWSDSSDVSHDAAGAAQELTRIISAAAIPTPFIYVGHSLGANFAQVFAAAHPSQVEALVLLEPGRPVDLLEDFHGTREEAFAQPDCPLLCRVAPLAGYVGLLRLASFAGGKSFPEAQRAQYRAGIARASSVAAAVASFLALPKTGYQTQDVSTFGDTPVLTLTSSELRSPEGRETVEDVRAWRTAYREYLGEVAAKSKRGVGPIEIPDSTHASMVLGEKQSIAVVEAIRGFVGAMGQ
jgi:pimeloyl-ACP methyl ester carboxylesterase